jgi:hypothetical protein
MENRLIGGILFYKSGMQGQIIFAFNPDFAPGLQIGSLKFKKSRA